MDETSKQNAEASNHLDAENETVMLDDMNKALEHFQSKNPTTASIGSNAGVVLQQVVSKLTQSGFSLWSILPKIFALVAMIQAHGDDIMKIVDEFKKVFGGPNQE